MVPEAQPEDSRRRPVHGALVFLGVPCALEVAILYVLIAVDTPLAPAVRRAIRNPGGLFAVVMFAFWLVCICMLGLLAWVEWRHRRPGAAGATSGEGAGSDTGD